MYKKAWCTCKVVVLLFFPFSLPSPSSLLKLPPVVIQKFCYHSNVTSLFFSLYPGEILKKGSATFRKATMKGYYGKMCKWPMVSLKRVEWRDMEVLSVQIQTLNRLIYFPEVFPILFCFQLAKATIACNYKLWFKTYPIFFSWIFKFSSHCCLKKKKN